MPRPTIQIKRPMGGDTHVDAEAAASIGLCAGECPELPDYYLVMERGRRMRDAEMPGTRAQLTRQRPAPTPAFWRGVRNALWLSAAAVVLVAGVVLLGGAVVGVW